MKTTCLFLLLLVCVIPYMRASEDAGADGAIVGDEGAADEGAADEGGEAQDEDNHHEDQNDDDHHDDQDDDDHHDDQNDDDHHGDFSASTGVKISGIVVGVVAARLL